jgi:FKBP-type peptidyl-prolyl cis-trans isomerase
MRHSPAIVSVLVTLLYAAAVWAQGEQAPPGADTMPAAPAEESSAEILSYALGYNIGQNLRSNEVKIDLKSMQSGVDDGLSGKTPPWPPEKIAAALQHFQQQMQQRALNQYAKIAEENKKEADAFLDKNRQREGVQVTPSGLQYSVLRQGDGPSPTVNDTVRCHYRGTLMDGTEFDSSYGGEPVEFAVKGVIPGWTEALQKMRVGDKWQVFVPADLGYGMDPPGPPLEPNSLLIFEVELLGVNGQ